MTAPAAGNSPLRERGVVMTARARVGRWLEPIAPGAVDRIAPRAIAEGK